ncbi:hypothetical protein K469DRAFT_720031 [Zopfia rhizophila CBS 207.26]|uniref:Uncharacterized protein n=1 Tax=Zopfia rhizophila CBS 207.26 TaxID=1314779 RepID=A0A6A6EJY2_9PEZI|nr:hypothetical protein K469DRAFT_720031 [Zopfia rhizophila CBS 207.26]
MTDTVALPPNSNGKTIGLLLLSLVCAPLAIYLDGATNFTILINLRLWMALFPFSVVHAWVYILRSEERRQMSRPARYRLRIRNPEGIPPHAQATAASRTDMKSTKTPTTIMPPPPKPSDDPFKDPQNEKTATEGQHPRKDSNRPKSTTNTWAPSSTPFWGPYKDQIMDEI